MAPKLIILDRDGVINQDAADYIKSPEEWQAIPGSIQAISLLSQAGFMVMVVTNQSGLGRGYFNEVDLANMHTLMHALVEDAGGQIAGVFYCPHRPDEGCHCRKPETGLLKQIEAEFGLSVKDAFYIGDSAKDLDCALAAGCRPVLVKTGKGAETLALLGAEQLKKILVFDDLLNATRQILAGEKADG
ncbi:MAG: D-glycero-beta-D-manno-heptose 1,7-bisphosphate 7-phosphatase [Pseudomonadales bacterium]|nr:D-glycero-beta-D-manno-heptose 1,7-bisphosphate 7-phosphatase [Pseudomonadales bacterium]